MSELMELLERVKAATGPDRELDFRIHIAVVDDAVWPVRDRVGRVTNPDYRMSDYLLDYSSVINSDDQDFDFPRYTASIDAAIALVERKLPGKAVAMGLSTNPSPFCGIAPNVLENAQTLPLAILAALLTALTSGASS